VLYAPVAETIANYFRPVGLRMVLQPIERAGFFKAVQEKRLKNVILIGSGALGNAATRLEAWVAPGGTYVYGSYPDVEELWRELAAAPDQKSRGVLLERIQRLVHDKPCSLRSGSSRRSVRTGPVWRSRLGPDRQLPVLRPVRGSQAQSEVTIADMIVGS